MVFLFAVIIIVTLLSFAFGLYRNLNDQSAKAPLTLGAILSVFSFTWLVSTDVYVNSAWFESVGYSAVYWTQLQASWVVGLLSVALFFSLSYVVMRLSWNLVPSIQEPRLRDAVKDNLYKTKLGAAIGAGVIAAICSAVAPVWEAIYLALYSSSTGVQDPIHGVDTAWYLFSLPAFKSLLLGMILLVILSGLGFALFSSIIAGSLSHYQLDTDELKVEFHQRAYQVGLCLSAVLLLLLGVNTYLGHYGALYDSGTVSGAGAAYVNVYSTGFTVMQFAAVIAAVLVVAFAAFRRYKAAFLTWGGYILMGVVMFIVAFFYQQWYIAPQELQAQQPYIENSIEFTRHAFGLSDVDTREFPVSDSLDPQTLEANQPTLKNARLWDWRALELTLRQQQEIRPYYKFVDVDVDRYQIGGESRQLMLAAREMSISDISNQTWQNRRLKYTHGMGAVAVPVNEFSSSGEPNYLLQNIPPETQHERLNVTQPRIYYGQVDNGHAYVNSALPEFDYPKENENATFRYDGNGGLQLGSGLRALALAWETDGITTLISDYLADTSKVLIHRQIRDRIQKIAPFLAYDKDAYLVIHEGRLKWMVDAYTRSDYYPYSQEHDGVNYIRNPVKVVVDAYDGSVDFYTFDQDDPIIQAWSNIFPSLFQPKSAMPDGLIEHIRYPEELLRMQRQVYTKYHMENPDWFYNEEDMWEVPREVYTDTTQPVDPYYVSMQLPESDGVEFTLIQPFSPRNKKTMVGWLAGRSDGKHYGELISYQFPRDRMVPGVNQIETRISQDNSSDFSMWNQRGTRLIRGNLLVLPVGDIILYVEPIYVVSTDTESPMPQLRRVALGFADTMVYGETYESTLSKLSGPGVQRQQMLAGANQDSATSEEESGDNVSLSSNDAELRRLVRQYIRQKTDGDFAAAGETLEELREYIQENN